VAIVEFPLLLFFFWSAAMRSFTDSGVVIVDRCLWIVLKLLVVGVEVSESDALLVLSFLMSFVSEIELPNQLRVI